MNKTTHYPIPYWLVVVLVLTTNPTLAAPQIDIEFETDQSTGQEWIHAKANCQTKKQWAYEAFSAIVDYPELHDWIQNTKAESEELNNHQEFLIEFDLPWPVGKQWSRVEIQRSNSVISWHQIEGSLNMNRGRIVIAEHENQAQVDYRAILDLGYPDVFTRGYKEQFVTEFLVAIFNRLDSKNQLAVGTPENSTKQFTVASSM